MMRAVGYRETGPIDKLEALIDVELPIPSITDANSRDLLVKVHAVSVNPVDTKVRSGAIPLPADPVRVLGYDAAGIVEQVGTGCQGSFKKGDSVYYSGSLIRAGTNAEYHLVDERIVGHKPPSLTMAEAAALPLTTITAYEMLFERLDICGSKRPPAGGDTLLIIGGAGGVGSMAIQLARVLAPDMTIIATASRDETEDWVRGLGAHHIINHRQPMAPQFKEKGLKAPGYVFSTTHTKDHLHDIVELMPPQSKLGMIDDTDVLNVMALKKKSISFHWELMFTRPLFETPDMDEQGKLLDKVSKLVEEGKIKSTATVTAGKINAETLINAHTVIESHKAKGKIVLEGF